MLTVLKVLRTRAGLTQQQLAERCNLFQSEVSKVESGQRMRNLDLLALHFDIENPDDLLMDWDTYRDRERERDRSHDLVAVGAA